jgi:FOXP coiled-coil domain
VLGTVQELFFLKMCIDADEQEAVQLACTRLQELSCKWDGCSVKMNSVDALIRHLNRQHKPSSTSHSNVCLSLFDL